ncbi:hypothetical protein O3M35_003595 [Rhynocoris fuscipes]|uniref:Uncharacterized protein n=1 Tax=Rhynocoris fuscipes TaxID=488301 RepID=A0AAW1CQH2_9HEMI
MAEGVAYMSGIMALVMMTWCLAQAGSHRQATVVGQDTPSWLTQTAAEQNRENQQETSQGSPELLPPSVEHTASKMIRIARGNRPFDVPQIVKVRRGKLFFEKE